MKKALTGLLTVLILLALIGYAVDRYILSGDLVAEASMRPSDINPHPTMPLQVAEGDGTVTVYLRSEMGSDYTLRVMNPADETILEETVTGAHHIAKFDAPVAGTYRLQAEPTEAAGKLLWVQAYRNDRRIFYPLYRRFF